MGLRKRLVGIVATLVLLKPLLYTYAVNVEIGQDRCQSKKCFVRVSVS
jgi:hypothetical protein